MAALRGREQHGAIEDLDELERTRIVARDLLHLGEVAIEEFASGWLGALEETSQGNAGDGSPIFGEFVEVLGTQARNEGAAARRRFHQACIFEQDQRLTDRGLADVE